MEAVPTVIRQVCVFYRGPSLLTGAPATRRPSLRG
jgi:hypothetical protein